MKPLQQYITNKRTLIIIGVLFVLVGLGITITLQRYALATQLNDWKLLPQPERLTELYFTDHLHLPIAYTPSVGQKVSFTVHNLEYQTMTYTYEIVQQNEAGDSNTILATGSFTLDQNSYQGENTSITYQDAGPRSKIIVNLINKNQVIDYWVDKA